MSDERSVSFLSGFKSNSHLLRFLIAVGVSTILIVGGCFLLFGFLGLSVNTPSVKVSIAGADQRAGQISRLSVEDNGFFIELQSGEKFANLLVPANKLWIDSNIKVSPGDRVRIISSGSVNLSEQLSLNLSNDPAAFNLRSFNFLVGPRGEPLNGRTTDPRDADELRSLLKIRPDAPLGMLLATIVPDERRLRKNPRAGDVVTLEEASDGFIFSGKQAGNLYLTVNDLVGSRRSEDREVWLLKRTLSGSTANDAEHRRNISHAYLRDPVTEKDIDAQIAKMERRWQAITENRYFEAFIEDNSGNFMVSVSITPSRAFSEGR